MSRQVYDKDMIPERRLDDLDLSSAILGEGVVLQETPSGGFVLYEVVAGSVTELGRFDGAADAWLALDALDPVRNGTSSGRRGRGAEPCVDAGRTDRMVTRA
jgi:hypothetical protein